MHNKFLHALTNRNFFLHPGFRGMDDFVPSVDATADRVRDLLGLNDTEHDYYIVGLLQAVAAFPHIRSQLDDPHVTYDLLDYRPPVAGVSGASLLGDVNGPPAITIIPAAFPTGFEVTLVWRTTTSFTMTAEGLDSILKVRHSNGTVFPEWGACGIRGRLVLADGNAWADGCEVIISHTPVTYPYRLAVQAVSGSPHALSIIDSAGCMEAFYSSQDDVEKMAVVALALASLNKAVYP